MAWTSNPIFIGAHFWFAPKGSAFTSPAPGTITQDGAWPDVGEPNWPNWALGTCESFEIDAKYGPQEQILAPSPGAVKARDVVIPFAIPEVKFTTLVTDSLAVQLALNTGPLWGNPAATVAIPNAGGGPGVRGIFKAQKYDQNNNLLLNYQTWGLIQLATPLKGAPKAMTKPEFMVTILDSANNTGAV